MAEGMNRATLIGNLGVDPELKTTNNGGAVLKLRLATTSRFKGRDGTWQENTEWHAVDVWGDARASALHGILAKGARLFVEGEIRTRSWETTTGEKRYATSIHADKVILLDSPKPRAASPEDDGRAPAPPRAAAPARAPAPPRAAAPSFEEEPEPWS